MKTKTTHDRSKDNTTITLSISKALLKELNEAAELEGRNRSNFVVFHLAQIMKNKSKPVPKG